MISISYYNRNECEYISKDIEFNEILEFGIVNHKSWNKNGTFKKWVKKAYVRTKEYKYEIFDLDTIKKLKQIFKGKYDVQKHTESEYKNYNERKATDWNYIIINKK